jgi:hypothetical protein
MKAAAVQPPALARITSAGEAQPYSDHVLVVKRIDLLLELGRSLVQLAETASEYERKPGRLLGAFSTTRLPLLLGEIELTLTALDVLGGRRPEHIVNLVEQPALFAQNGSGLILAALDEIKEAIMSESVTSRRGRSSVQAAIERARSGTDVCHATPG